MPMMYIKSSIWSGFEIENWIEDQFQSSLKLVGIWTVLRCIFVPNLEIVTSIGGELWHAQAQNWVNFDFGVQFDLEGHDPSLNGRWVIARTNSWLTDTHTYTHTHAGNDNNRRPKLVLGKNDILGLNIYLPNVQDNFVTKVWHRCHFNVKDMGMKIARKVSFLHQPRHSQP